MEAGEYAQTTLSSALPMGGHWQKIESNPVIFNELLRTIGVRGAHAEEVYTIDEEFFNTLRKAQVYGFILLLRHKNQHTRTVAPSGIDYSNVYFANQVIPDACATQAILSVVLNAPQLDIGPSLRRFKDFTADFSPKDDKNAMGIEEDDEEDPFHYIAYVPIDGHTWELDGLRPAPVRLDPYDESDWLSAFRKELVAKIEKYSTDEAGFVLMAIMQDPVDALMTEQQQQQIQLERGEEVDPEQVQRLEKELEIKLNDRAREQLEIGEKTADFRPFLNRFITLLRAHGKV
ncbi:Ubiquitin carboxyl-terminal hydrolase bap1 [Actinomortierella ambigua]|uniref:ubiquitinyl hydrolase 1 n=1 Tax=Actinomortierella ambigua TaxID=1343610 RepID=A0A9P6Q3C2_9FUNG|nr:Ubiquitin carboxyl-terminal hydrolase bap1 [Actinomortierella ambigua]